MNAWEFPTNESQWRSQDLLWKLAIGPDLVEKTRKGFVSRSLLNLGSLGRLAVPNSPRWPREFSRPCRASWKLSLERQAKKNSTLKVRSVGPFLPSGALSILCFPIGKQTKEKLPWRIKGQLTYQLCGFSVSLSSYENSFRWPRRGRRESLGHQMECWSRRGFPCDLFLTKLLERSFSLFFIPRLGRGQLP